MEAIDDFYFWYFLSLKMPKLFKKKGTIVKDGYIDSYFYSLVFKNCLKYKNVKNVLMILISCL